MKATRTAALVARRRPGALAWTVGTFGITVDTREQRPWAIATEIPVTVRALEAGDYSATGLEGRCAIERKSLDDFVRSITWEADRFRAELVKLKALDFAAIIVEGTLEDVRAHRFRARVTPDRVLSAAAGIGVHYAPVHFAGTPQRSGDYAVRLLRSFHAARPAPLSRGRHDGEARGRRRCHPRCDRPAQRRTPRGASRR